MKINFDQPSYATGKRAVSARLLYDVYKAKIGEEKIQFQNFIFEWKQVLTNYCVQYFCSDYLETNQGQYRTSSTPSQIL
jgi:hypothetical protein